MILNENLQIDASTGIISSDRKYTYSINQVDYMDYAWQLSIHWPEYTTNADYESTIVGEYLYAQKKGALQDVQLLKDLGYILIEVK